MEPLLCSPPPVVKVLRLVSLWVVLALLSPSLPGFVLLPVFHALSPPLPACLAISFPISPAFLFSSSCCYFRLLFPSTSLPCTLSLSHTHSEHGAGLSACHHQFCRMSTSFLSSRLVVLISRQRSGFAPLHVGRERFLSLLLPYVSIDTDGVCPLFSILPYRM